MDNQWVLEWSKRQNAFNIRPASKLLAHNQNAFLLARLVGDYIVIMFGTKEVCEDMADTHRDKLIVRQISKLA